MTFTQPNLPPTKKTPKKRRLSLAVTDVTNNHEPLSNGDARVLVATTRHTDISDFSEGRDDPAQSAELERQQDA